MLVKKKNPEWFPSENKELRVGEVIEMTNPQALILSGDAVGLDESGAEVSAYELYGVLVKDELAEFKQYQAIKKAEAEKAVLEKQRVELEAELAAQKAAEEAAKPTSTEAPVIKSVTPVVEEAAKPAKKK